MKTVRGSVWGVLASCACFGGCADIAVRNTAIGVAAVVDAGHTPTTAISQVYYLGVFDPQGQLPPTIYRVRVNGQASALSFTKFASGWVRADLVDSLSGRVPMPSDLAASGAEGDKPGVTWEREKGLLTGRRLVMFGPEGFREAPRDHRLVVVMGSDPSVFFSAVDEALGSVAAVTQGANEGPSIEKALWTDLARVRLHGQRLNVLNDGLNGDYFPEK